MGLRVQQLTEVEEVLEYRKLEKKHGTLHAIVKEHRLRMQSIWRDRILSCHQRVEVYGGGGFLSCADCFLGSVASTSTDAEVPNSPNNKSSSANKSIFSSRPVPVASMRKK